MRLRHHRLSGFRQLFGMLLPFVLGAAEMDDLEWETARAAALARPRRLIINNDGCDATNFPEKGELTVAKFREWMLDKLKGSEFDTMTYCPFSVGLQFFSRSKLTPRRYIDGLGDAKGKRNASGDLEKALGRDPMELAREFAREQKIEFFGSIRVNDVHDQWHAHWLSDYKKNNPQLLCGTPENRPPFASWTSFDYARPEVRELLVGLVDEMIREYDLDGIELDFYRMPNFFKTTAWGSPATDEEVEMFTQVMRDIRRNAEAYGRQRGRPVLIGLRLPDSPEVGRYLGLDIERWMQEKLFDLYFAGGDQGYYSTPERLGRLCRKYGIKFYCGIDMSFSKGAAPFNRNHLASLDAQSAAAYAAGADGLYFFNLFYLPGYISRARRNPDYLVGRDKLYFVSYQGRAISNVQELSETPLLIGGYSATLMENVPAVFPLRFGDDLRGKFAPGQEPTVQLYLRCQDNGEAILARLDGQELRYVGKSGEASAFEVPRQLITPGIHQVELSLRSGARIHPVTILAGNRLLRGANQPPWRRLWAGQGMDDRAEEIIDGAYRLSDRNRGDRAMVNLLHPLAGIGGQNLTVEFDCRVLPDSEELSAVMRLANGDRVEIIDFRPEEIRLVHAGKQVDFPAGSDFHHYRAEINGANFKLTADGKVLFDLELPGRAGSPECALSGHNLFVQNMETESLIIGSLTGPGVGASEWRNLVVPAVTISDLSLEVKFPPELSPGLAKAAAPEKWDIDLDFSAGIPKRDGIRSSYAAKAVSVSDGGTVLDNETDNEYAMIDITRLFGNRLPGRTITVEWEGEAVRPSSKAGQTNFLMLLRPLKSDGSKAGELPVRLGTDRIVTPYGTFPASGTCRLRAVADPVSGTGAVFLNDRLVGTGPLVQTHFQAGVMFGDVSSNVSGVARLRRVRATLTD